MKRFTSTAGPILFISALVLTAGCWKMDRVINPPFNGSPYVGAAVCGLCHEDIYVDYMASGHSQQFQLITDGKAPEYFWQNDIPYPIQDPPEGLTWDEISLVLGGYYGYGLFFGRTGDLITGPGSFWVISHGVWGNYDPEQSAPYDCARCHTTGFDPAGVQSEFSSLQGSWEQNGVTCEACHGPGRAHVRSRRARDIVVDGSNEFCFSCHRDRPGHPIPGFADVDLGNSHPGACTLCHDPHISFKYDFDRSVNQDCASCHQPNGPLGDIKLFERDGICDR